MEQQWRNLTEHIWHPQFLPFAPPSSLRAFGLLVSGALAGMASNAIAATASFVDNAVCEECHHKQFAAWRGSHHDLAMQTASSDTVLGDFEDAIFSYHGVTTRFFKRNGRFYANLEGPDGGRHDYAVMYTIGVEPLQQYLIELPGGRLQVLTAAWDTDRRQWFTIYPDDRLEPGNPQHWTGIRQNWNGMCAECHSTDVRKGYDAESDKYETTWSAINVGCQACHGPGREHVAWAHTSAEGRDSPSSGYGLVAGSRGRDARHEVAQCARCHSRRQRIGQKDRFGPELLDDFVPATLRAGLYHPDGQINGEVYVYGSFVQSKMYGAGVRCSDCHEPHSTRTKLDDNALCTRCHQAQPDPRFPGLQSKIYDSTMHHFHAKGSDGARCVSCHMPGKFYMTIDYRRDHSFRVPRPDLTVSIGTPNACNTCHTSRSAQWAAADIASRFGAPNHEKHYGEAFAAARAGKPGASRALVEIAESNSRPGIVRATAFEILGQYGPAAARVLAAGLSDPDPLVRISSLRGMGWLPLRLRIDGALKVIDDPVRGVRVEAARLLTGLNPVNLPPARLYAYEKSREEYEGSVRAHADFPGGRVDLALLEEARGNYRKAEHQYLKALEMDRYHYPARFNLAVLLNRQGRNAEAVKILREGIGYTPNEGELRYSIGLLLAEQGKFEPAAESFTRAAERLPARARIHYNLGLALERIGRGADAERALLRARTLDPRDADVLHALALHFERENDWQRAEEYAQSLVNLAPQSAQARQLLARYRALLEYGGR